jgi:hypothetical protein
MVAMNAADRRTRATETVLHRPGLMAPPVSARPVPGLMAISSRPGRGLMELHPSAPPFEWSRDGVAFLWLVALILALVVWVVLVGHGVKP